MDTTFVFVLDETEQDFLSNYRYVKGGEPPGLRGSRLAFHHLDDVGETWAKTSSIAQCISGTRGGVGAYKNQLSRGELLVHGDTVKDSRVRST